MSKPWWFLSISLLLVFLLVQVPARFIVPRISPANPAFSLHNINGSLWQGRVDVVTPKMTLHNVQWTLKPIQLLLGRAQVELHIDDGDVQVSALAAVGFNGALTLRDTALSVPATKLDPFLPMRGLQMQGELQADISELRWHNQQLAQLQAQIKWRDAGVRTPMGNTELGDYRADLKQDESGAIAGTVNDLGGVLDLQGKLSLANNQLSFNGSVKRELPDHILRFFKMFARDNGSRLEFTFNRQLAGASQ